MSCCGSDATAVATRGEAPKATSDARCAAMARELSDGSGRGPVLVSAAARAAWAVVESAGANRSKTLLATSTCPDELNCQKAWSPFFDDAALPAFRLGGLAGLPFAGATGFAAYSDHVPDDGAMFIFYGPHVGVSGDGSKIGRLGRRGQSDESSACGACAGALAWAKSAAAAREGCKPCVPSAADYQMDTIKLAVAGHLRAIEESARADLAVLSEFLCDDIRKSLRAAIDTTNPDQPVFLLGGIQINGDEGDAEYFAPRHFELRLPAGAYFDKLDAFHESLSSWGPR